MEQTDKKQKENTKLEQCERKRAKLMLQAWSFVQRGETWLR